MKQETNENSNAGLHYLKTRAYLNLTRHKNFKKLETLQEAAADNAERRRGELILSAHEDADWVESKNSLLFIINFYYLSLFVIICQYYYLSPFIINYYSLRNSKKSIISVNKSNDKFVK